MILLDAVLLFKLLGSANLSKIRESKTLIRRVLRVADGGNPAEMQGSSEYSIRDFAQNPWKGSSDPTTYSTKNIDGMDKKHEYLERRQREPLK